MNAARELATRPPRSEIAIRAPRGGEIRCSDEQPFRTMLDTAHSRGDGHYSSPLSRGLRPGLFCEIFLLTLVLLHCGCSDSAEIVPEDEIPRIDVPSVIGTDAGTDGRHETPRDTRDGPTDANRIDLISDLVRPDEIEPADSRGEDLSLELPVGCSLAGSLVWQSEIQRYVLDTDTLREIAADERCGQPVFGLLTACWERSCPGTQQATAYFEACLNLPDLEACVSGAPDDSIRRALGCLLRGARESLCDDLMAAGGMESGAGDPCLSSSSCEGRRCSFDGVSLHCGECLHGWQEDDGVCRQLSSCDAADCGTDGECLLEGGDASCRCAPGYFPAPGLRCQVASPENEWVTIVAPEALPVSFEMGTSLPSETAFPCHTVSFEHGYALQKYPVTVGDWRRFLDAGGTTHLGDIFLLDGEYRHWLAEGRDRHPLELVTQEEATAYCAWIGAALPTEAQWEYAAYPQRDCDVLAYPWGGEGIDGTYANFHGADNPFHPNRNVDLSQGGLTPTAPVGFFDGSLRHAEQDGWTGPPEVFQTSDARPPSGISDAAGNVHCWTQDCWHESYHGAPDDGGAWLDGLDCEHRIKRGGDWQGGAEQGHLYARGHAAGDGRFFGLGFRCARQLPSSLRGGR